LKDSRSRFRRPSWLATCAPRRPTTERSAFRSGPANVPNYYGDMTQRELAVELADYLAKRLELLRQEEAGAARILRELVKNQRLG
jgi:hypothetical protein